MTNGKPTTPEGNLLRVRREMLGLNVEQACQGTPLKRSLWGDVERGRTRGRAGKPSREWHASDSVVAIMAMRLGVTAEQLRSVGRADAAGILDLEMALSPIFEPPAPETDLLAAADDMFDAFAADRRDAAVIRRMWYRSFDAEGRLMPLAARMRSVTEWLVTPRGSAAESDAGTG